MKTRVIIFAILSIFCFKHLDAQIKFGIKAGIHSYDLPSTESDSGFIGIKDADYGFHLGAFTKIHLAGIYVEPSLIFNNIVAKYSVIDSSLNAGGENFVNMDIPLIVGFKFLFLDIHGGPVAHVRLSDYNDLLDIEGVGDSIDKAFWGIQVGTSLGLGEHWCIEVRYEKNFEDGDIEFDLEEYSLIDKNSRVLASLAYNF